jgi:hypothetical protein
MLSLVRKLRERSRSFRWSFCSFPYSSELAFTSARTLEQRLCPKSPL